MGSSPLSPAHLAALGSQPMGRRRASFGAAQQFCLTRVGQELSFCRAAWIKVGVVGGGQEAGSWGSGTGGQLRPSAYHSIGREVRQSALDLMRRA